MDEKRAKLIRQHWKAYRSEALDYLRGHGDVFRCRIHEPMPAPLRLDEPLAARTIEALEFRMEFGGRDGKKIYRVMCEGLEVESNTR